MAPAPAPAATLSAASIGDDELAAGLWPVFAELKLDDALGDALAWCRENGADSLAELVDAGAVDEFVEALNLKKLKAVNLRKRLVSAVELS